VIVSPTNNAHFEAPADIFIMANGTDRDGQIVEVSFFANQSYIGGVTNPPPDMSALPPWRMTWHGVPAGIYSLQAHATDDRGGRSWSPAVRVEVRGTNQPPPRETNQIVITIEAVDSVATEQDPRLDIPTDPALFLVRRHGSTNIALTVFYHVGGSASNGVDYEKLSGEVRIPAGATMAEIFVEAIDDLLVEGTETVIVNVIPPVCPAIYPPPPECYAVGRPDTAIAYIRDNDAPPSNSPPTVRITAPPNGSMFREGSDIKIEAVSVDRDGYAPMVEFFANGRKIGEQIISFIQAPPDGTPIQFSFTWSNVAAGSYTLTARATDEEGATALSAPVGIRVGTNQPPPPPPTNVVVSIVASDSYASEGPWTNWSTFPTTTRGTNTAEFVVRRAGPTNDPVTVRYHIGGTASNGVDYAALSSEVIIPAGVRGARILVVPLEDSLVEGVETVILELAPSSSDSYVIGLPRRAAAVIADNDSARPPCMRLPGGLFHVCFPGTNGSPYRIEASSDLIDWTELCTGTVTDGAVHFVDPDVDALPYRFYVPHPAID
ncbi:MAG TPA: Ig-like domain-containing protein, partial [Candidatus Binatia bacterium]|nr:Ig-like domain-containing protein [Candidatus Binatia bacterium]